MKPYPKTYVRIQLSPETAAELTSAADKIAVARNQCLGSPNPSFVVRCKWDRHSTLYCALRNGLRELANRYQIDNTL